MLQLQSVRPETLDLLKKLMNADFLEDFILVGGTALALQIGHRKSYDLDLFTARRFDPKILTANLKKITDLQISSEAENTLNALIGEVPVDFIRYDYPLEEMFGFYEQKYQNLERFHLLKSLVYFDDAEDEPEPIRLIPVEWNTIR